MKVPACSTIHANLDRHRLVSRHKRSRTHSERTPLSLGLIPNALWCTDHKGEFKLGNQCYCYPLSVTDHASRYLLLCAANAIESGTVCFTAFERLFKERRLPAAIQQQRAKGKPGNTIVRALAYKWFASSFVVGKIAPPTVKSTYLQGVERPQRFTRKGSPVKLQWKTSAGFRKIEAATS